MTTRAPRMTITYGFVKDGGFAARDDVTGHCYYCYPTSSNAEAANLQPEVTAISMLRRANDQARWMDVASYDESISAALDEIGAEPMTATHTTIEVTDTRMSDLNKGIAIGASAVMACLLVALSAKRLMHGHLKRANNGEISGNLYRGIAR